MISRKEYMANSKELHQAYYVQFATKQTFKIVEVHIGLDNILNSTDKHFNDIPLERWDRLESLIKLSANVKLMGLAQGYVDGRYSFTLSDAVCIAKAAARAIRERHKGNDNA